MCPKIPDDAKFGTPTLADPRLRVEPVQVATEQVVSGEPTSAEPETDFTESGSEPQLSNRRSLRGIGLCS